MSKFLVIKDTREKEIGKGWSFNKSQYCDGTLVRKVETGDYSIEGYEDDFTIERKGCISEFAHNIIEGRFDKEVERMRDIEHSFVILEFNMSSIISFPVGSGIPKSQWKKLKIRGPFVLRRMCEIMTQNPNIKILPCGPKGKDVALSLFKRVIQNDV